MSFLEKGFLGSEVEQISKAIYEDFKDHFDLCFDLNQLAYNRVKPLVIPEGDYQKLVACLLFLKMHNSFQSIVVLSKRGLPKEAKIILRSYFESYCILKLVIEREGFYQDYMEGSKVRGLKLINVALSSKETFFKERRADLEKLKIELQDNMEEKDKKQPSIEALAEMAGLTAAYDTFYRVTSSEVHSTWSALREYLMLDEDLLIQGIDWGPIIHDIDLILITSIEYLAKSLELLLNFFDADGIRELQDLLARAIQLAELLNLKFGL